MFRGRSVCVCRTHLVRLAKSAEPTKLFGVKTPRNHVFDRGSDPSPRKKGTLGDVHTYLGSAWVISASNTETDRLTDHGTAVIRYDTIRYDTSRDAVLTCARKLT